MAINRLTQVINGAALNFGSEILCESNVTADSVAPAAGNNPATLEFDIDGVGNSTEYTAVLSDRENDIIYKADFTSNSTGDFIFPLSTIIKGSGTVTYTTNSRFDIRIYERPVYLGITEFSLGVEYEYATLKNENNNKVRDDIIKRTVGLSGKFANFDFSSLQRVFAMSASGQDDLHLVDETQLVRGIVVLEHESEPTAGETAYRYTHTLFYAEWKPNGEIAINPRESRKMIPFTCDGNFDVDITAAFYQLERTAL